MPAEAYRIFTTPQFPEAQTPPSTFPAFAYFGREPYSYIQRVENRYQFTDNFSWTKGKHGMKFGGDFNYLPITATFTVNYGGVYDFGALSAANSFGSAYPVLAGALPTNFPIPDSRLCSPTASAFPEISSRAWQSERFVLQQTARIVLAGFLARSSQPHAELWPALRRGISATVQASARSCSSRIQRTGTAEGHQDRLEQYPTAY